MSVPFCIMKPVTYPTLPPTITVPPFIEMPARAETSPRTTTVPPDRGGSPIAGILLDDDRSAQDSFGAAPAGRAVDLNRWAITHAAAVVAHAALEDDMRPARSARRPGCGAPPG